MNTLNLRETDTIEGINLCGTGLLLSHIVMVLSDILNSKKTKIINPVRTLENGGEFIERMIGGLLLIEGKKDFSEFPLSIEGLSLAGYFYKAAKELQLVEKKIVVPEKSSDFAKRILNTLRVFTHNSTVNIADEEIYLAREFFSFLADKFLSEYQSFLHSRDDDD